MARLNVKKNSMTEVTHEGAPAYGNLSAYQQLRRSLLSCFLWEDEFYEDGETIADRIIKTAAKVDNRKVAELAIEARTKFHLRHAPLLLLCSLAKTSAKTPILSETLPKVIKRADEVTELLAIYWRKGKTPISAQLKKGLANAIKNFDEYGLAKYNRDGAIKLRDVLFLTHAKPYGKDQEKLFKKLAENELEIPDTWEVALSGGADKKETFERLMREDKLGGLAILRNLRNMFQANVNRDLIKDALANDKKFFNVYPFRFVAAARACPQLEREIDAGLLAKIKSMRSLPGKTVVLVDVSCSMDDPMSGKSDLRRIDAAASLASIIQANELRVFSFSNRTAEVPPRRGMAGVDAIVKSQPHGGTDLGGAVDYINAQVPYDRLIVITDEQSHTSVHGPKGKGYMINVASNKNGVGYGPWVHIDGFSERVIDFIFEYENLKTED